MLGYIFAIRFCFLLCPLFVGLICGEDHYSFALKASKKTHLPSLGRSGDVGLIQDVVSFLTGSNFNEFAQEERSTLGDGRELRRVFVLSVHCADLRPREEIRYEKNKETEIGV